jgi:mevalonate kinase
MNTLNEIRVPGKLMLSGEYAVLYGGESLLVPVNRYLTIKETGHTDKKLLESPVIRESLLEKIPEIEEYEATNGLPELEIDRSDFLATRSDGSTAKLGIGSSAAEAVGIIELRLQRAGFDWKSNRERVAELAENAHKRAQGGVGSGADVFVCAYGQPIRFKRSGDGFEVKLVKKPSEESNLPLALIWTEVAADTRIFVKKFQDWIDKDPESKTKIAQLVESSNKLAKSWFSESQSKTLHKLDDFLSIMNECAIRSKIEWKLPIHDDLDLWARKNGGISKPTGAGGGDIVLMIGDLPLEQLSGNSVIKLDPWGG